MYRTTSGPDSRSTGNFAMLAGNREGSSGKCRLRVVGNTMGTRVGIVGTGFVSRHFCLSIKKHAGYAVSRVLTRRAVDSCTDFPARDALTNSADELADNCDVVLECTGDPVHAAEVVDKVMQAGLPVVTMNSEFHVTAGSYFVDKGLITEAEGDQPGAQAALKEDLEELGFKPLVFGNMKAFLNHNPTPEEMAYWGKKQDYSLHMVTSFTDGTKVQVEQALVANGLDADIARTGLLGPEMDDLHAAADILADHARATGRAISDYMLSGKAPHGVFVVGTHDAEQETLLSNMKLGDGPNYVLEKMYILGPLEIMKTIRRVVEQGRILLNNSACPRISVATVAKRKLTRGTPIDVGIGSFDVRGVAVRIVENVDHVPIGLVRNAVIRRTVEPEQILTFDDMELPESVALGAWLSTRQKVLRQAASVASE